MTDETAIAPIVLEAVWAAAKADGLMADRDWLRNPTVRIALPPGVGPRSFEVRAEPGVFIMPMTTKKTPVLRFWAGAVLLEERKLYGRR